MSQKEKLNVVFWPYIPAPYWVERFNMLAKRGNINFEAWFNSRSQEDRSWDVDESTWEFRYRYLPAVTIGRRRFRFPLPVFQRRLPDLIITHHSEPVFIIGMAIAKMRGARIGLWAVHTFDTWFKRRWFRNMVKRRIFARVDAVLTTGEDGRRWVVNNGAAPGAVHVLKHPTDIAHFGGMSKKAMAERESLRAKLGLKGVTYIYVGRLWKGKGLDTLLKAFKDLRLKVGGDASLMLVGDGNYEPELRRICVDENISGVVFPGFIQKPELPRYYAASDVFVFPTLGDPYGLVIDEAMACSLPIISSTSAGEITDRVKEGENGHIVPAGDSARLCQAMEALYHNGGLRHAMGRRSAELIAPLTIENWAVNFEELARKIAHGEMTASQERRDGASPPAGI